MCLHIVHEPTTASWSMLWYSAHHSQRSTLLVRALGFAMVLNWNSHPFPYCFSAADALLALVADAVVAGMSFIETESLFIHNLLWFLCQQLKSCFMLYLNSPMNAFWQDPSTTYWDLFFLSFGFGCSIGASLTLTPCQDFPACLLESLIGNEDCWTFWHSSQEKETAFWWHHWGANYHASPRALPKDASQFMSIVLITITVTQFVASSLQQHPMAGICFPSFIWYYLGENSISCMTRHHWTLQETFRTICLILFNLLCFSCGLNPFWDQSSISVYCKEDLPQWGIVWSILEEEQKANTVSRIVNRPIRKLRLRVIHQNYFPSKNRTPGVFHK